MVWTLELETSVLAYFKLYSFYKKLSEVQKSSSFKLHLKCYKKLYMSFHNTDNCHWHCVKNALWHILKFLSKAIKILICIWSCTRQAFITKQTCEYMVVSSLHLDGPIVQFSRLFLLLFIGDGQFLTKFLHNRLRLWFEENHDGVELCVVELLHSCRSDVENCMLVLELKK